MHRLDSRHLYCLRAVATAGHLPRVADQVHPPQSALSVQIRRLRRMVIACADALLALGAAHKDRDASELG